MEENPHYTFESVVRSVVEQSAISEEGSFGRLRSWFDRRRLSGRIASFIRATMVADRELRNNGLLVEPAQYEMFHQHSGTILPFTEKQVVFLEQQIRSNYTDSDEHFIKRVLPNPEGILLRRIK